MSPASKDVGPFFILPWSLLGPVKGTKRPKTAPETDKPAAVRRYRVGKDLNGKMGEQKGRDGEATGTAGGSRRVPPRLSPRALPTAPLTVSHSFSEFSQFPLISPRFCPCARLFAPFNAGTRMALKALYRASHWGSWRLLDCTWSSW